MFSYIWSDNSNIEDLPNYNPHYIVHKIVPLLWLEHCVECAMPLCYNSCEMYENRGDGRCRRFDNGTQLYKDKSNIIRGASISFRRWSKLEGVIRTKELCEVNEITRYERVFNIIAGILEQPCKLLNWEWHRPSRLLENLFDEYVIAKVIKKSQDPINISGLYILAYNHEGCNKKIHFEFKQKGISLFHSSCVLKPGWNETLIELPFSDVDINSLAQIYIDNDETAKITFKYLDIVIASSVIAKYPAQKVKCVAWDLDNTMWDGVIGDDGKNGVVPKESSIKLVKKLDEMGVLQTIVSKNEYEIAWTKLTEIGIADFFLYPAINWGRKSQSLLSIAKELNINVDTFAVIDDSEFERHEISTSLPQVRVYDVKVVDDILSRPEFDIQITEESKQRRQSYIKEFQRKKILASWSGDYSGFLKECGIKLNLFTPLKKDEINRCFELIQRSNQYNITINRRSYDYINSIIKNPNYRVYSFKVSDKFGTYGIVGFSSFEKVENNYYMRDFVMSCRVAQKSIEKAFFSHICSTLENGQSIIITIEKTDKNNPVRSEMLKLPFIIVQDDEKVLHLKYTKNSNNIIKNTVIDVISN